MFCSKYQLFKFYCTPHNYKIYVHLINRCNTFQIVQKNHFIASSLLPKVSEYDQEIAQSHTWHCKVVPQNINSNKISGMVEHYHIHLILSLPCNCEFIASMSTKYQTNYLIFQESTRLRSIVSNVSD